MNKNCPGATCFWILNSSFLLSQQYFRAYIRYFILRMQFSFKSSGTGTLIFQLYLLTSLPVHLTDIPYFGPAPSLTRDCSSFLISSSTSSVTLLRSVFTVVVCSLLFKTQIWCHIECPMFAQMWRVLFIFTLLGMP